MATNHLTLKDQRMFQLINQKVKKDKDEIESSGCHHNSLSFPLTLGISFF